MSARNRQLLLDPGFELTLRPMRYPQFYEMYRAAIKNTWTVEEIDFQIDLGHLVQRMTPADRHLIQRLVAFFATGDGRNGRGRGDRDQQRVAQAVLLDAFAQAVPTRGIFGDDVPGIELQFAMCALSSRNTQLVPLASPCSRPRERR